MKIIVLIISLFLSGCIKWPEVKLGNEAYKFLYEQTKIELTADLVELLNEKGKQFPEKWLLEIRNGYYIISAKNFSYTLDLRIPNYDSRIT